jgi:hypothetical protein
MSRTLRNGRRKGDLHHVRIHDWERESPAWRALSGNAVKLLIAVRGRYFGSNNGAIALGVREAAAELGMGIDTAARAFRELEALGFIRCARESVFGRRKMTREWTLTDVPLGNQPATKDFIRWRPGDTPPARKKSRHSSHLSDAQSQPSDGKTVIANGSHDLVAPMRLRMPRSPVEPSHASDTVIGYQGERGFPDSDPTPSESASRPRDPIANGTQLGIDAPPFDPVRDMPSFLHRRPKAFTKTDQPTRRSRPVER